MAEEAERNKRHGQRSCALSKTALAHPLSYMESTFSVDFARADERRESVASRCAIRPEGSSTTKLREV